MKNKLCLGTFMRLNKMNFLILLTVAAVNAIFTSVAFAVSGGEGMNLVDSIISIFMVIVPIYIFMSAMMNAVGSIPKCIILSTPRKKLYKTMIVNDMINIVGTMVVVCVTNFIVYGELKLDGLNTGIVMNLKFICGAVVLGIFVASLIEYICFMFTAFNVYYGLANIFVLVGVGFYFIRDIYFMSVSGNVTFLIPIVVLGAILLLYVNYILINKLEVRG